jgi:hypothetical protein
MKYYNLHIDFEPSWDTYNQVTKLLGVTPQKYKKTKFDKSDEPTIWTHQIEREDEDEYLDFINLFMDMLEPQFDELLKLGIDRENILIWLVYVYTEQCALEFSPDEMKRLGEAGISFNIDCHEIKSITRS